MDARASMRAMLENARQSIRNRATNVTGAPARTNVATIVSSLSSHPHKPAESRAADGAENLHFTKDVTGGAEGAAEANALNAKDNRMQFVQHYYRLLLAFIEDKSKYELELPNLSALDRMVVHALAEKCNLSHESAGARADRVMHLKKDILFFQHPEAAQQVNLDEIIEKVSWKESKYQIRYVRSANPAQVAVGDIGSYADEDALQKIERFRRATDEYRHATDMGYTQQELLLAEAGEQAEDGEENYAAPTNVEEILSRPDPSVLTITAGASGSAPTSALTSTSPPTASTAARAMKAAAATPSSLAKTAKPVTTTVFDEVCRACGSRVRLDGPPQGWKCSHYCAHCTRQTIWSLEEVKIQETRSAAQDTSSLKRGRDAADAAHADGKKTKRPHGEAAVEQIDREEDADEADGKAQASADGETASDEEAEEGDDLTVEDVMEVAATNDFNAKDMNWLREFASRANAHLSRQIAFCIDFSDAADMPIFARYRKGTPAVEEEGEGETNVWYVVLREVRDLSLSVSDLLREVLNEVFANPSVPRSVDAPVVEEIQTEDAEQRAMEHLGVAFPNLSVYGTECVAVCQLRPVVRGASVPRMQIKPAALRALRQRYGERHVFASPLLEEAVAHATDSVSA
ncbi:hypothetical protein ABB37_01529 [Leptomonas pyrrhocoris]|uniref:R3H domain-containing protein n=1 Tax=Leptomonas pyrrhocoris TaxID=157538 RepID=A0A0M9G8R7_LEPPY|nr:hypothetical protein ABB37_01529 [Leptomonas pyrrhocoris]KPA85150.1 hypothetical protein ABB37_01529 [Leptomonas pyrrhocoris]|eukprot:XP_015663589.1 hypothetical protein ABB37_01529 [Leptomonas pyrrhocoris]